MSDPLSCIFGISAVTLQGSFQYQHPADFKQISSALLRGR